MPTPQDISNELMGAAQDDHHAQVMGLNGPNPYVARSVQDKLSHAAHEVTVYLPRRTPSDPWLQPGEKNKADTVLGHSIDAASYGRLNFLILERLAEKLKVDISDILSE